ncbi:MAG: hypothetical protein ACKO0M_11345 [Cyanobium sp.]
MGWDPAVLRKYNTTGHFRLLNQLRSEIRERPLIRPGEGETVGDVNRSRSLIRAIAARAQAGISRSRRAAQAVEVRVVDAEELPPVPGQLPHPTGAGTFPADAGATGFRNRLSSIDLR